MSKRTDMLGRLMLALGDVRASMLGLMLDIANKFNSNNGEQFYTELAKFVRDWRKVAMATKPQILHLFSAGEELIIGSTDGSRTIAKAENVFHGYIDPNFKNWGLDVSGKTTLEGKGEVHEMRQDAIFSEMFRSLERPLSELVLSQDEIIDFCEKHFEWLRADGYATFCLFEENRKFFVADVHVHSDGLYARVNRFEYSRVWDGENRPRLVVPQQDLGA